MKRKFNFEATGIGSVPFKDSKTACRVIFENFTAIPFWPQLPKRSFLENMYTQFAEQLPGLVIDEKNKTIHIDTSDVAQGIEELYAKYLDGDVEFFRISESHAQGLYEFIDTFDKGLGMGYVKGHVTGPVSFALSVTDHNKRPIIYDRDIFEVVTKMLSMKAAWQIRRLKSVSQNVIIFIDEPYLVSVGSSYVNIDMELALKRIDEVDASIKGEGALSGIHCCGNTDWSMLLKRNIDILNFDAYNYVKEFSVYAPEINDFLARGGTIAWGIIPSSEAIDGETDVSLVKRLGKAIESLVSRGINRSAMSSIITPSCGAGTMGDVRAEKTFRLANAVSREALK